MKIWSIEKTQDLIREINTIEYSLKRTPQIGMFILNNFIELSAKFSCDLEKK